MPSIANYTYLIFFFISLTLPIPFSYSLPEIAVYTCMLFLFLGFFGSVMDVAWLWYHVESHYLCLNIWFFSPWMIRLDQPHERALNERKIKRQSYFMSGYDFSNKHSFLIKLKSIHVCVDQCLHGTYVWTKFPSILSFYYYVMCMLSAVMCSISTESH